MPTLQENWKPVPDFEGRYEVSDLGRVLSHVFGGPRVLRPGRQPSGHVTVTLGQGKSLCVHALVLRAFVGAPSAGEECRHLNGDPGDNRLTNLAWGTRGENTQDKKWHGCVRKLTVAQVAEIKATLAAPYHGVGADLARRFGVGRTTISNIKLNKVHVDV